MTKDPCYYFYDKFFSEVPDSVIERWRETDSEAVAREGTSQEVERQLNNNEEKN